MIDVLVGITSLLLIAGGLCYFLAMMSAGLLESRRQRGKSSGRRSKALAGRRTRRRTSDVEPMAVYFLVPCLNEEAVIGSTLVSLLQNPRARVVVVDDGSDDRTPNVV